MAVGASLSIRQALGRLDLGGDPEHVIPDSTSNTLRAGALPPHQRDSFGGLLIAQVQIA